MRRLVLMLCVLWMGCSQKTYRLPALELQYRPPKWARLLQEELGPPPVAHFYGGLEVRAVKGLGLPVDAPVERVLEAAALAVPGQPVSVRTARMGVGPVGRYEFASGATRTLLYYVPLEGRGVLLQLPVPPAGQEFQVEQLEASLETLKVRR